MKNLFSILFVLASFYSQGQTVSISNSVGAELTVCEDLDSNSIRIVNNSASALTSVEIGFLFPNGISYQPNSLSELTNKNVALVRATADSGALFTCNAIPVGDSLIFSFQFTAGVKAVEEQNNGTIFKNRLTLTYTGGQDSKSSNAYNILYPVLPIASITPKNQTIVSGTSGERTLKVINGGNGRIASFWIVDSRNKTGIQIDSTNIGELYGDSILLDGADFSAIGNNDDYLDQNEFIEVTQYFSGSSCSDLTVTSSLQTAWGCGSEFITGSRTYSNVAIDFQTPNLSLETVEDFKSCFASGIGQEQKLIIVNKGSGVASDVYIDIYNSKGGAFNDDILAKIDVSSIKFKIGQNGLEQSPVNPDLTTFSIPNYTCLGTNPVGKVIFNAGDLNPSDTMFVIWDMVSCCISTCDNQAVKGWRSELHYSDICGTQQYEVIKLGQDENEQYTSIFSEAPADIFNNSVENFSFVLTGFKNTLPVANGAHYKVVFNLNAGLVYDDLALKTNGATWTPSSLVNDTIQNTVTATYSLPGPFNIGQGEFDLALKGVCGSSGWKYMTMNLYYIADTTCSSNCEVPLVCNYQTSTFLHCPGVNCSGLSFTSFEVERTNFGLPDNNQDGLPDGSGVLNQNQIRKNRAMVGDSIQSVAKATIVGTGVTWDYASFASSISHGSTLSVLNASFRLYDASASTWYDFNNMTSVSTISGTSKTVRLDLSSAALANLNATFVGFSYAAGDSLEVKVSYELSANVSGQLQESTFSNDFYVSSIANPTSSQKQQCTFRNGRITFLGYGFRNEYRNYYTLKNCAQVVHQYFGMSIGTPTSNYAGGNLFPFEYRHWSQMKKAEVTVPDGYVISDAKIDYYRTVRTGSIDKTTVGNILPQSVSGSLYTYDLSQYFTGGTFEKSDDGYHGVMYVTLAPTCTGVARNYENVTWSFEYEKTDLIDGLSSGLISGPSDRIRYRPAQLSISSIDPIQDAISKSVSWDFKVKNISSSKAENSWVYLETPTSISIDSVKNDKDNTLVPVTNGFYELGNLNSGALADLTIYGNFSNCGVTSFKAHSGYSCDGYPSDLADVTCYKKEMELSVEPKKAQYQVRLSNELMQDPCEPKVLFTLDVTSVEIAHMYDMVAKVFSADTSKISILPGSTMFRSGSNNYASAQDPSYASSEYVFNLNDYNSSYSTNGIPGILDVPDNNFKLQFMVKTGSNYQAGDYVEIQLQGKDACGVSAPTMFFEIDLNSNFSKDETAGLNLDIGNSWSASWGDYDNDGYDDLFVPINDVTKPNILYHNNGNGTFSKVTTGSIVNDKGASIAGTWGDYDNDGYIDLFVSNNINSSNKLYHNNGDGTFSSVTNSPIVDKGIYSHAAAWSDYNRDGNLDLVVSDFHATNFNFLFLGDGNGGFEEDKASDVGLSATSAIGVSWGDYDNDGDPDLFIANTNGENNQLFKNEAGVLKEERQGAIVNDGGTSVGGTWGDYDNDGDLDLFVSNSSANEANFFYENNGDGTFTKDTSSVLVTNISNSHGASWVDVDNDGYLDLMVANDENRVNFLFRNNGDKTFTKITNAITQEESNSYGTAWSDFDRDGDYDLVVANRGDNANDFFVNGNASCTNHIVVELDGCNSNSKGIGAFIKVKATINGISMWQTKDVATQNSAMGGQNSSTILFGLGDASSVDSLIVIWPSGIITSTTTVTMNALNVITEQCGSKVCGVVYYDANNNGTKDSTEVGIPNQILTVSPGNISVFTGADGRYEFYLQDGSYTLSQQSNSNWSQVAPSGSININVNSVIQSEYCGNDFGNTPNCLLPDLSVTLGNTAMRRGLLNDLDVQVVNEGAFTTTGNVDLELSMSTSIFLTDTSYSNVSVANGLRTYTYNLGIIDGLSDTALHFQDSVDVYATLNDTITMSARLLYSGSECDTFNNTASFSDIIVGSVDPNDKQVFLNKGGYKAKSSIRNGDVLTYKIRFQNMGNYAAQRVQIVDTLSPLLDWSTFEVSSASHPFSVSIVNGVVTWVNENIELPDSASDEEGSNGFVMFSISPKTSVAAYTVVHNVAHIQFDRNPYIATNDAATVVGLSDLDIDGLDALIYPVPAKDYVNLIVVNSDKEAQLIKEVRVLDKHGVEVRSMAVNTVKYRLLLSELPAGIYIIKMRTANGLEVRKRVVKL